MKNYLLIACFIMVLSSCSKNSDPAMPPGSYSNEKGTWINVANIKWYLTKQGNGGDVNLHIDGSTNADKISIKTSGDGVLSDNFLALDDNKNFSEDLVNSFTVTSVPTNSFISSTKIVAYRGTDVFQITLYSDPLKY